MTKDKNKKPFNVLSKKGFATLALAGVMAVSPFVLTGCGEAGPQGSAGNDGTNGATWYSGTEYSESQGVVGDFFYDTNDFNIYQKTADGWTLISNIRGPQGEEGPEGPQGPTGPEGPQGQTGTNGATWLTGTTTPADTLGNNGDLYLNTNTFDLYQKVQGVWGAPICNIKGPQGEEGPEGPAGEDGTKWFTGTEITGTETSITATITGAVVGDLYLNIDTANVYKCTAENTWQYLTSLATEGTTPTPNPGEDDDDDNGGTVIPTDEIDITSQFEWTTNQTISSTTQGTNYVIGQPCSSQNFKASGFIDVSEYVGRTIKITVPVYCTSQNLQATMAVCAYNSQNQYLATIRQFQKATNQSSNTAEYFEFEVIEGYEYIRTAWYNDNYENYTFEDGFSCVVLAESSNITPEPTPTPNPGEDDDDDNGGTVIPADAIDLTSQINWNDSSTISSVTQDSYVIGQPCSSTVFKATEFIDVSSYVGRTIKITVPVYTTSANRQATMGLCAYDSTQNFISVLRQFPKSENSSSNTVEYFEFVVTSNMHFIRTAYYRDSYENYTFDGEFSCIVLPADYEGEEGGEVTTEQIDLTNTITYSSGTAIDRSTGNTKTSSVFKASNFIDISQYVGRKIRITLPVYISTSNGQVDYGAVLYSSGYGFFQCIRHMPLAESGNTVEVFEFVVPSGAAYLRFTYYGDEYTQYTYEGEFSCVVLAVETNE